MHEVLNSSKESMTSGHSHSYDLQWRFITKKQKTITISSPGTVRKYREGGWGGCQGFLLLQKGEATMNGYLSAVKTRLHAGNIRLNEMLKTSRVQNECTIFNS